MLSRSLIFKSGGIAIDTCDNQLRVSQDIYSVLLGDRTCGITSDLDPSSVMVYITSGNDATKAAADLLSPRLVTVITPDASGKKYIISMEILQDTITLGNSLPELNVSRHCTVIME